MAGCWTSKLSHLIGSSAHWPSRMQKKKIERRKVVDYIRQTVVHQLLQIEKGSSIVVCSDLVKKKERGGGEGIRREDIRQSDNSVYKR